MNSLPIGMFRPGTSKIHALTALTKLLCLFILIASAIFSDSLLGYGVLFAFALLCAFLSGLRFCEAMAPAWRLRFFFLLIFLMNLCFFSPEGAWLRFGIFCPSRTGLMQGLNVVARVFFLLVMSNILTLSTAPLELCAALEQLLRPLGIIGVPTAQVAMILSVAVQFIPGLFEETDMIRKAQTARGAGFDSPRIRDKAAAVLPLVLPVFIAAFRRADELALAMEARGYRTNAKLPHRKAAPIKRADALSLICCAALCLLEIFL